MKFLLGTKVNMIQIYDEQGLAHPATVLLAGPVVVLQVKTKATDGYNAVQIGFGEQKEHRILKAQKGHAKNLGNFRFTREFRLSPEEIATYKVGDKIDVSTFAEGQIVFVRSKSKGKGFQGVVKRHHFKGGSRTHGQKHSEREPGTIGGGLRTHVPKGMRMAGRMGGDMVTVQNLKVLQIQKDTNELVVLGSLPGVRGALVEIHSK
jgi:large subunit ribosomal protein L3